MSDTARFNEAAGLPKHEIEEVEQPGGAMLYLAAGRQGPFRLAWREHPVNWVAGQWLEHCRVFSKGPLSLLCARLFVRPREDGCEIEVEIEASANNPVGWLLLHSGFFPATRKMYGRFIEDAGNHLAGRQPLPFSYAAPQPSAEVTSRVENMVERIEGSSYGHGLARRLAALVFDRQEVDLIHLRPLRLAREWSVRPREAIELCLEATRTGLLDMRWDLLCPRCQIAKASAGNLGDLPKGAHCGTCNIDYDGDFSRNVELSFAPARAVRPVEAGEYCLFGPMSTPHIWLQLTLQPGEERHVALDLPAGAYRLRTLERGPQADVENGLEQEDQGFPSIVLGDATVEAGPASAPGEVRLINRGGRVLTAILEERRWARDALTADRVTSLQAFRDLFSDQVLRPGDEVAVRRIALMFTDLKGSTALFDSLGDARAYHLVRDHFAFLARIVRDHDGAVVKTIGDGIMAGFLNPADALRASLAMQRAIDEFNAGQIAPLTIKLGLHDGPAIAVTLNERLDYFGATVNKAARLQGESQGGDIVLSGSFAEDPAVAGLLADLTVGEERCLLRGFAEEVAFLRIAAPG